MEKEASLMNLQEMSTSELLSASGGGDADDLAYVITYALLSTSPFYWMIRYNVWLVEKIIG